MRLLPTSLRRAERRALTAVAPMPGDDGLAPGRGPTPPAGPPHATTRPTMRYHSRTGRRGQRQTLRPAPQALAPALDPTLDPMPGGHSQSGDPSPAGRRAVAALNVPRAAAATSHGPTSAGAADPGWRDHRGPGDRARLRSRRARGA